LAGRGRGGSPEKGEGRALLRLVSYNVLEGALPDRLPAVLRVLGSARADVIAIQEARYWRRNRREAFRKAGRHLRMPGLLAPANSGFDIAIFTRLPVLHLTNHGRDTMFLHTGVSVDLRAASGETFALFVTHLRPDLPGRLREARLLLEWMRPYRGGCCALCGDLNSLAPGDPIARELIWPDSELGRARPRVVPALVREGWRDCFRQRNPRAPGYTLGAGRRVARVDYIFASKPLAGRLKACHVLHHPEAIAASDHSPVWAEFAV